MFGDDTVLDEILFFQLRIFRLFCDRVKVSSVEGNKIFERYGIWKYIEDTYDVMHLNGDENALSDVLEILKAKGADI